MLPELDTYDWEEAFKYAGNPEAIPTLEAPVLTGFERGEVASVKHLRNGQNDGEAWVLVGKLHDGRWFRLTASCDYTGWG